MTERDLTLFRFAMMSLAIQRFTSVEFWYALDHDEAVVMRVQQNMKDELKKMIAELWP